MAVEADLAALAEGWADAGASELANAQLYLTELANAQLYLTELADALGVCY